MTRIARASLIPTAVLVAFGWSRPLDGQVSVGVDVGIGSIHGGTHLGLRVASYDPGPAFAGLSLGAGHGRHTSAFGHRRFGHPGRGHGPPHSHCGHRCFGRTGFGHRLAYGYGPHPGAYLGAFVPVYFFPFHGGYLPIHRGYGIAFGYGGAYGYGSGIHDRHAYGGPYGRHYAPLGVRTFGVDDRRHLAEQDARDHRAGVRTPRRARAAFAADHRSGSAVVRGSRSVRRSAAPVAGRAGVGRSLGTARPGVPGVSRGERGTARRVLTPSGPRGSSRSVVGAEAETGRRTGGVTRFRAAGARGTLVRPRVSGNDERRRAVRATRTGTRPIERATPRSTRPAVAGGSPSRRSSFRAGARLSRTSIRSGARPTRASFRASPGASRPSLRPGQRSRAPEASTTRPVRISRPGAARSGRVAVARGRRGGGRGGR